MGELDCDSKELEAGRDRGGGDFDRIEGGQDRHRWQRWAGQRAQVVTWDASDVMPGVGGTSEDGDVGAEAGGRR